jgi:hypothetical protein
VSVLDDKLAMNEQQQALNHSGNKVREAST